MALKFTFKGGIHVPENKSFTEDKKIETAKNPKIVYIPLHQHVGAPCKPLVKKGDIVKIGQKIGDSDAAVSAPVHSSISGVVKGIEKKYSAGGRQTECIVIESDGEENYDDSLISHKKGDKLSHEEIEKIVREAGIVGMGGAGFPTGTKLITSKGSIDSIILNGAECEPYLTCDHRLMLEEAEKVINGLEIMLDYFETAKGYIGVEDNKKDAIEALKKAAQGHSNIEIITLESKFPQGDSYRMVDSILKRKVPQGGRGKDVNCIINNVGTAAAISDAVLEGKPSYERIITVTGNGVKTPKNLMVKIGTTIGDVIEQCGGFNGTPAKIISGGPMTGITQFDLDAPIIKATCGILVLNEEEVNKEKVMPCIKCGKCVDICPVFLEPLFISANSLKDRFEEAEALNALSCIACGSCSFICPAKRPLTESIVHAKREINKKRRKS
ncbi:electron transport complex subunit RsxC [Tissierella creatinophila]|uniref:Ion-translocating oxidoreductase complex subunit C n=1 Tax=Tissierella creatinophila DSM 6911 TaxID=1123403 RepID=A0A1U7M7L1_TISCR|nr:electron transport complex subunit RsxC [Tissierella creatinophila]OLS03313.1 electron transport complex subunit RnfC [Tissierella creatinophila DSM 6911]